MQPTFIKTLAGVLVSSTTITQIFIEETCPNEEYQIVIDSECAGQLCYGNEASYEAAESVVQSLLDTLRIKVVLCSE